MKGLLVLLGVAYLCLADDTEVLKKFSTGYDTFSSEVYKQLLKSNSGNFIVCPLSVDIVLALVNAGAREQTSKEMVNALRLPENPEKVQQIFKTLSPHLQANDKYNLSSANKVFVKEGFKISDHFKSVAVDVFDADIQNIDFTKQNEAAAEINQWVEDKTRNKIKDLIKPADLNNKTRSVLVNAIYFHGKWVKEFNTRSTYKGSFHVNNKNVIDTDLMNLKENFEYYESSELNAKFLKLDYEGGEVSMHIVLPNDVEGLAAIEQNIEKVLTPPKYTNEKVVVTIPKFKTETMIKFKSILQEMGIHEAFEDHANFRGISTDEDLKISEVIQKAFIEVEEKGTTAAAATGVLMIVPTSIVIEDPPPKFFRADHPFLFYLRLNKPGVNFFVGRYTAP